MSGVVQALVPTPIEGLDDVSPVSSGGEALGRYTLLYELAAGGMATLYLARVSGPAGFQKLVAIKRIHPHLAKEPSFVEMFLDEARIAAGIQHPNVAQIYELGQVEHSFFIVMEYVEGESLARFARAYLALLREASIPQRMPIRECAAIVAEAAAGLHAAHELRGPDGQPLQLVHRDVSPHNILLTYDGFVKLVDFGVAKARGRVQTTTERSLKGKLAYMSPEQVQARTLDRRSDIFSLGIVLYEMTCGRRLFKHEVEIETLRQILEDEIVPPHNLVSHYPPALEQVVMRALHRDREQRFLTADEMRRALQAALLEIGPPVGASEIAALMQQVFPDRMLLKQRLRESSQRGVIPPAAVAEAATDSGTLSFDSVAEKLADLNAGLGSRRRALAIACALAAIAAAVAIGYYALRDREPTAAVAVSPAPAIAEPVADSAPAEQPATAPAEPARPPESLPSPPVEPAAVEPAAVEPAPATSPAKPRQEPPKSAAQRTEAARPAVRASGKLTLKTTPWAEVRLYNRSIGETPLMGIKIGAGTHTLLLLPRGQKPGRSVTITIKPGEHLRQEIDLR
ncbi:MAG: protein kinase [Deltaproteobacteria bacterium]|nr:protein kinase [Deltaproteobacteria bacterium]